MVIMEAMAMGRPIISTYIAAIPELVHPGKHGWLVPAGDVTALTEAMQACLDAPVDTLSRMGAAAYERVLSRHNVETQAAKLAGLFEGALAESEITIKSPCSGRSDTPISEREIIEKQVEI